MSQRTIGSTSGVGAIEGGPITAVAGIALLINVVGLYAFPGVALCVFGYIALVLVLSSRAERSAKNMGSANAGNVAMILSCFAAIVGGALVGAFHWVQYTHAAYVVLGLYALATCIWLAGRAYSALWSWLFPSVGAAMLAAVMMLGSPPGADDMDKSESWTPVNVTAVDEDGQPIDSATVYLDLEQFWQGDPALDGDREWWTKSTTNADGVAQMALHEDPRFKRLVVRVRREPFAGGYNEPQTIGSYTGYEDERLQTWLPAPKVPYSFQVVMKRRPHPDSALLAIELQTPDSSGEINTRGIKVALTTEPELPWYEGTRTFNDYLVTKTGRLHDLYIRGSQRLVIRLDHELAARHLTLHILERDWSQNSEAYLVRNRLSIDPIPLGNECILPVIALPSRNSRSSSPSMASGLDSTDRR